MKMQRYHGRDMRQALARVRAELGPDAVIVSTQRTDAGVVVCAAVDFEPGGAGIGPASTAATASATPTATATATAASTATAPTPADVQALPRMADVVAALQKSWLEEPAAPMEAARPRLDHDVGIATADTPAADAPDEAAQHEIRSLRRLLESQAAALAWNDFTRRHPLKARVLTELASLGLARDLALQIVAELPDQAEAEAASRLPLAQLARRIETTSSVALQHGGVLALVGPNGVGKTTTLAKFATRWVVERGPRELALVSTDRERFGAQEQIEALGRVLGVPALVVENTEALAATLERLRDRRLVLVDTPGLHPRSERIDHELTGLGDLGIEVALVLSASAQAGALEECALRFGALRPAHCVLARVDEAASLGGAISTLVRAGLPLSWLCVGPRVPEDIEAARAHQLVARAVRLARSSGASADEDLLARRFGGLLDAAA
jgi:flagellar biosynthesis protein FlhF